MKGKAHTARRRSRRAAYVYSHGTQKAKLVTVLAADSEIEEDGKDPVAVERAFGFKCAIGRLHFRRLRTSYFSPADLIYIAPTRPLAYRAARFPASHMSVATQEEGILTLSARTRRRG